MRRILGAAAVLALFPTFASAVVTITVERAAGNPGGVVTLEVFGENPDASEDERLNAYTMVLRAPGFGPPGGDRPWFVVPAGGVFDEPTAHPYIFGQYPGNAPADPAGLSDYQSVFLSAGLGGAGQEANLTDARNGFAKVSVMFPENLIPGFYPIFIDPGFLSLGSAGATPVVASVPGGIEYVPEPGSLGLVAAAGVFALRRRRAA